MFIVLGKGEIVLLVWEGTRRRAALRRANAPSHAVPNVP